MFSAWRVFAVLLLLLNSHAALAIVTVGPGCTFSTLQQAINTVLAKERANDPANPVDVFIGVAGDVTYNEVLNIDSSNITSYPVQFLNTTFDHAFIQIFGDYAPGCGSENGSTAQLNATGKAGSAIFIHGGNNIEVILKNLLITGANNQEGTAQGGGIDFNGTGKLDLTNIDINGNRAGNLNVFTGMDFGEGGGIFTFGASPGLQVVLHNTTIENNTADIDGGGIVLSGETHLFADDGTPIIISGNSTGFLGGGLMIRDASALEFSNTGIGNNQAQNGAGIYADGPVNLLFDASVSLVFNTASDSGGGILLQNGAKLDARSAINPTQILLNTATTGFGGGVYVNREGTFLFTGTISGNSAGTGGGIAVRAETDGDRNVTALAALKAANPTTPTVVSNNTATNRGGGIYVKPSIHLAGPGGHGDNDGLGEFCAADFQINNNSAADGAAIYEDTDSDAFFSLGGIVGLNSGCSVASPICAPGASCNEISGNQATAADGSGAIVALNTQSSLTARRVRFQDNQGGYVISARDLGNSIKAFTLLMTDNIVGRELINADQATFTLQNSTLAHNTIGAPHVIRAGNTIGIASTIFNEAVTATVDSEGNNNAAGKTFDQVLTNPADSTLTTAATSAVYFGTPRFVNVANRDYHLKPCSLGVDTAPAGDVSHDLDNGVPDVDLKAIANKDGPRDLGAYELQSANDEVFCTEFE